MEFSHRQRSNTAQRLEKMDMERKKAAKVKHVKWEHNPSPITPTDQSDLFQRKDFRRKIPLKKGQSLLSEQLEKCPHLPPNPFKDYAIFDGNAQVSISVRKYRIFMCMLPKEDRMYPLQVAVVITARVLDFVGLICYKYASEHPDHNLKFVNKLLRIIKTRIPYSRHLCRSLFLGKTSRIMDCISPRTTVR